MRAWSGPLYEEPLEQRAVVETDLQSVEQVVRCMGAYLDEAGIV